MSAPEIPNALIQLLFRVPPPPASATSVVSPPPPLPVYYARHHRQIPQPIPSPFSHLYASFIVLPRTPKVHTLCVAHACRNTTFIHPLLKFHIPPLKYLALASPAVNDMFLYNIGHFELH